MFLRTSHKILNAVKKIPQFTLASAQHSYNGRKFPELLYFPHLFRWLNNKIKFKYLKARWDPEFSEGAFIYGTTQAICRITQIINENDPDKLQSLLTKKAETTLRSDMQMKLSDIQKHVIGLKPEDIKLLVPMRINLVTHNDTKKTCSVLLKSLSMKWYEDKNVLKLVLIVIETEFQREYKIGEKSDWIISLFNIVQCVLLGGNSVTNK